MSLTNKNFIIKRNDTLPAIQITIATTDCLGGKQPFNLSGVSATTFTMVDSCGNNKISLESAQIVNTTGGTIQYSWQDGDTDIDGKFSAEFQLFFTGGGKMSVPQDGSINIEILKDINPY